MLIVINHFLFPRDLKSPNILLKRGFTVSGKTRIIAKVADFGLSRKLLLSDNLKERVVDNPTWLAPEIIRLLFLSSIFYVFPVI